jgi:ABC-type glycerol-3-phosphate transport system substrate-binding protein
MSPKIRPRLSSLQFAPTQVYWAGLILFAIICNPGCGGRETGAEKSGVESAPPSPPITLRVAFVDRVDLSDEIARRWQAADLGQIQVSHLSTTAFLSDPLISTNAHDLIVYPAMLLGHLVAEKLIEPVPDDVWNSEELRPNGLLRDSRTSLVRFDDRRWGVAISNPNLVLLARIDVLEQFGLEIPRTWEELASFARTIGEGPFLVDREGSPLPRRILFPLKNEYAAVSFLAVAAATVRHRGKLNYIFDRRTMSPWIDREPYVQSLQFLDKLVGDGFESLDADEVFRAYMRGEAALAITWPSQAFVTETVDDKTRQVAGLTAIARLPGSTRWFDFSEEKWKPRLPQDRRVDVIGFAATLVSVMRSTRHPSQAQKFLAWLGSRQTCLDVAAKSRYGSPSRTSHLDVPQTWTGDSFPLETAEQFGNVISEINEQPVFLMFPRIRGSACYFQILSQGLTEHLNGKGTAEDALKSIAEKWSELNREHGVQEQQQLLQSDFGN